jgi:hypothetical protein
VVVVVRVALVIYRPYMAVVVEMVEDGAAELGL